MYVDGNVLVAEFTDASAFEEVERINETFFELLDDPGVDAHVACLEMDGVAGQKMLDGASEAAEKGCEHGLRRWGVVSDGIGKLAVQNQVNLPELDVRGFDETDEALAWARA